jgi:hypothetical protein
MQAKALEPSFLHVYDVESGLWANLMLGSPVSPRILEAMNLILKQDGILAYIGTRSEFGHYLTELSNETGKDFRHCWTSLPASTILNFLGLCLNSENPRKPLLVFYGSPLTIALASMLESRERLGDHFLDHRNRLLQNDNYYVLRLEDLAAIGAISRRIINASEHYEALSYLEESNEESPTKEEIEGANETIEISRSRPSNFI